MSEVRVEDLINAYQIEHLELLGRLTAAKAQIVSLQNTVNRQALEIEELQQTRTESELLARRGVEEDDSSAVTIIG